MRYPGLDGQRVYVLHDGERTGYLHDGGQVIAEFTDAGAVTAQYIHGAGLGADVGSLLMKQELVDDDEDGTFDSVDTTYFYSNHRGDVIDTADENGDISASYRYEAFGQTISSLTPEWGFSSKRFDTAISLSYFGARYYDASIGRFISRDPMEYIDGPNQYIYCANNPMVWLDPFGLWKRGKTNIISDALSTDPIRYSATGFIPATDTLVWIKEKNQSRNQNMISMNIYKDLDKAIASSQWREMKHKKAVLHQHGIADESNRKFVSLDGKGEAVYDKSGKLVTSSENMGTYNYYSPYDDPLGHVFADVLPYYLWGTSEEDSTTIIDRLWQTRQMFKKK